MAEGLGVAASVIAVVDLSAKIGSLCSQYIKAVKNAEDDIDRLLREVTNFNTVMNAINKSLKGPDSASLRSSQRLGTAVEDSLAELQILEQKLRKLEENLHPGGRRSKIKKYLSFHALRWPFSSEEVKKAIEDLARCREALSLALQQDHLALTLTIDQRDVLDRLPIARGASFKSQTDDNLTCLANTRVELLKQILQWVHNPSAKPIFWLNGMAGTGKSTISRTIAYKLDQSRYLGASFFFKRGETDRGNVSRLMTTVVRQMADKEPRIAPMLKAAIEADSTILSSAIQEQFQKLIYEPLLKITLSAPLVVIIDALDECDNDNEVKLVIDLFARAQTLQPPWLRVFMTSRPELPIRLGFSNVQGTYQDLILHEIEQRIIERDIHIFLEHSFQLIRSNYNLTVAEERKLPPDWPDDSEIKALANITTPLFISAVTACRFIADRQFHPERSLKDILQHQGKNANSGYGATYMPVLHRQIDGLSRNRKDEVIRQFQHIVGTIITLASPLSASALTQMLNVPQDTIDVRLDMLHSVLHVPPSSKSPVRLLHLSFRDFLVDPETRVETPFWIDEKQMHRDILTNCLLVMNAHLRVDICDMRSPGIIRSAIDHKSITDNVPQELEYCCLYWVHHLKGGDIRISDGEEVHLFLCSHLLHWLEVLSLIMRASESLSMLQTLQALQKPQQSDKLSSLLDDATRFVRSYLYIIESYPLQIYSSLIAFSPTESNIRTLFYKEMSLWLSINGDLRKGWDLCLQTLEGHIDRVKSVVFSPDSRLVASASWDRTVRLWRADTGQTVQTLKGHSAGVNSVVFSPDSKLVASASQDQTVRLWHADTGQIVQTLRGHSKRVGSVVFSPNSTLVASASGDGLVRLWCTKTGHNIQTLIGHSHTVNSIVFSPDSALVASASSDRTVRLWSADTGQTIQTLKGHSHRVTSVVFSHDSTLIASASWDQTVRLWRTDTGQIIQTLEGHRSMVSSVVFSHDSTLVASASWDGTVRLWRTNTGQTVQTLMGHGHTVNSVVFSHDSALVASASSDRTVRLWRTNTGQTVQTLIGHSHTVNSVVFSPNSALVASASDDQSVRLWRTNTDQFVQKLEGHSDRVRSVVFSPDYTLVASASDDRTVRLWCANTGQIVQTLRGHSFIVNSVVFSHDSTLVASASEDRTVRLWCTNTGQTVQTLMGHSNRVNSVVFSPNSALVASASDDQTVCLWRTNTDQFVQKLEGHSDRVTSVVFSPNYTLVASASDDRTVRLWHADTGQAVQALEGHSAGVSSVAFSPDSKLVASASEDQTVRLWRADTGQTVQTFKISTTTLSFEHNNSRLQTDIGLLIVDSSQLSHPSIQLPSQVTGNTLGCGIDADRRWITWNGRKVLWLPVDFRPSCSVMLASALGIGSLSGRVIFIKLLSNELDKVLLID